MQIAMSWLSRYWCNMVIFLSAFSARRVKGTAWPSSVLTRFSTSITLSRVCCASRWRRETSTLISSMRMVKVALHVWMATNTFLGIVVENWDGWGKEGREKTIRWRRERICDRRNGGRQCTQSDQRCGLSLLDGHPQNSKWEGPGCNWIVCPVEIQQHSRKVSLPSTYLSGETALGWMGTVLLLVIC